MASLLKVVLTHKCLLLITLLLVYRLYSTQQSSDSVQNEFAVKHTPSIFVGVVRQGDTTKDVTWRLKETWLKRVDAFRFFSTLGGDKKDTIRLPPGDVSSNFIALYRWLSHWTVSTPTADVFDHYLFTFDRSYVIVNNLRKALSRMPRDEATYGVLGACNASFPPPLILSQAAVGHLARRTTAIDSACTFSGDTVTLCRCMDSFGFRRLNLATDQDGKARFLEVQRHFSRKEMKATKKKYGYYWDGKEIFDALSPDMLSFLAIHPLEQTILDSFLYRLNKQEI